MLNTLNNRIGRTLVTLILPLSMTLTLSLANNSFADMEWAPSTPAQPQAARAYSVTMNGTTITVRLNITTGSTISGVLLINNTECPFSAQFDGQTLRGTLVYGGNQVDFAATIQGPVMYLDCFGTHLVLQQIA
jgi:hypothetical protein